MGFYLVLLFIGIIQALPFYKKQGKQGKGSQSNLSSQRQGLFGGRNREQINQ
jgi:hypothetical protein